MTRPIHLIVSLIVLTLTSCYSKAISTIESTNYNEKKNETSYMVMPFGIADVPGKWTKQHYNSTSRQQFFLGADSSVLSIAFGSAGSFEFSRKGLEGFDFVKTYYQWETPFQASQGYKVEHMETDSANRFIAWKVHNEKTIVIYLSGARPCGCRGGAFQNYTISAEPGQEAAQLAFLKKLYLRN